MNNFLFYNTHVNQFQTHYPNVQFPFKAGDILTPLPKNIAIIRTVATIALTAILALKLSATVFCWPVVIVGMAFAGWTVYSHLYSKDSLMEAFYKISGGKDKFEKLPEILLKKDSNEKISEAIRKLDWDKLEHPIAKTKTLDGRNVIIIKGLTRNNEVATCQTKGILAFVERLGPNDVPRVISNVHELADSIMHAICPPFTGNTFSIKLYSSFSSTDHHQTSSCCKIFSFISAQMANEFFAQMK